MKTLNIYTHTNFYGFHLTLPRTLPAEYLSAGSWMWTVSLIGEKMWINNNNNNNNNK